MNGTVNNSTPATPAAPTNKEFSKIVETNPKPTKGNVFEKLAYGAPGTTSFVDENGEENVWS
jgi:hypothetical protein